MRVLFGIRPDYRSRGAGDTVQILQTRAALAELGVEVKLATDPAAVAEAGPACDLIHLFDLLPVESTWELAQAARPLGKPIVLSPIYWNPLFVPGATEDAAFRAWWERTRPLRAEVLSLADLLLPNGEGEVAELARDFGRLPPYRVVPNGADAVGEKPQSTGEERGGWFQRESNHQREYILCVGRISRRKNQIALIRALAGTGLPLLCVGGIGEAAYYEACRTTAAAEGVRVQFLDAQPSLCLRHLYAGARVHALPSWYETPGLVSLEAALAGCNLVCGEYGTPREYFGEYAFYCHPGRLESIRAAVLAAWEAPPPVALSRRVAACFTWTETARQTLAAYRTLCPSS